jgi:hypothetical protein
MSLDEFRAHTGLADPRTALTRAEDGLAAARAARDAARRTGDDAALARWENVVSERQERAFTLQSQVLTYERILEQSDRAPTPPRSPRTGSSADDEGMARRVLDSLPFVATAVAALVVLLLLLSPALVRRRL